jgi:hypothetical protein
MNQTATPNALATHCFAALLSGFCAMQSPFAMLGGIIGGAPWRTTLI